MHGILLVPPFVLSRSYQSRPIPFFTYPICTHTSPNPSNHPLASFRLLTIRPPLPYLSSHLVLPPFSLSHSTHGFWSLIELYLIVTTHHTLPPSRNLEFPSLRLSSLLFPSPTHCRFTYIAFAIHSQLVKKKKTYSRDRSPWVLCSTSTFLFLLRIRGETLSRA